MIFCGASLMDNSVDYWLLYIMIGGYLVNRIADRNLRWRVFGFVQIVGFAVWFFQFIFVQTGWIPN
jgi:hypothetical protein